MSLDSAKVGVAVSGEIYSAATATTAPTSTSSSLSAFSGLGYVGEDGVKEVPDESRESLKAWQNGAVVRESLTEAKLTYEFTLIETKAGTVELYYGTTVTATIPHGTYTIVPGATKGRLSFVFDVIDGSEIRRTYIAAGEVFKGDGVEFANGSAIAYPCELVCYSNPVVWDTRLKS